MSRRLRRTLGRRVLTLRTRNFAATAASDLPSLSVVQNWFEELTRLVPVP